MALHLNRLKAKQGLIDLRNIKAKNVVFTFLREEGRRKGGKARVWQEIKFWLALLPISRS